MMKENWVYRRGDIYCADLDPVVGSEQGGIRPVIVIQNDTGNKHAPTLIVATVTTRIHKKANMPTHLVIYDNPAFKEASVVQLEQIRTIDKSRIDNYLGKVGVLTSCIHCSMYSLYSCRSLCISPMCSSIDFSDIFIIW